MNNKVYSVVTGRIYNPLRMVYISNYMQTAAYMENGATLYDVLAKDRTLTCVFDKHDTRELHRRWKEKKL